MNLSPGKVSIICMKVTKKIAEHAVALMDQYNKLISDEEQMHFLLLIV